MQGANYVMQNYSRCKLFNAKLCKVQNFAKCKIMPRAKLGKGQHFVRCKIMQGVKLCEVQDFTRCKVVPGLKPMFRNSLSAEGANPVTIKAWAPKARMLMHNSGRYVRLCVRLTILILFKVYMYCFLDFFVLNFLKFLNKLCFYGANGLWSGATSISDGIFIFCTSDNINSWRCSFLYQPNTAEVHIKTFTYGGDLYFYQCTSAFQAWVSSYWMKNLNTQHKQSWSDTTVI